MDLLPFFCFRFQVRLSTETLNLELSYGAQSERWEAVVVSGSAFFTSCWKHESLITPYKAIAVVWGAVTTREASVLKTRNSIL